MNVVHEHLIWLDGTRFEEEEEKNWINNNTQNNNIKKNNDSQIRLDFFVFDHYGMKQQ